MVKGKRGDGRDDLQGLRPKNVIPPPKTVPFLFHPPSQTLAQIFSFTISTGVPSTLT